MRRGSYVKNAAILTAASLVLRLAGMWFRIYLANALGEQGVGLYELVQAFYAVFITLATAGVSVAATRLLTEELAQGREGALGMLRLLLAAAAGLGVLAAAAQWCAADLAAVWWLGDARAADAIRAAALSLPFMAAAAVLRGFFLAQRRVTPNAVSQIIEQAFRIGAAVVLLSATAGEGICVRCAVVLAGSTASEVLSTALMLLFYGGVRRRGFVGVCARRPAQGCARLWAILWPVGGSRCLSSGLHTAENMLVPACLAVYLANAGGRDAALAQYGILKGMVLPLLFFPFGLMGTLATLLMPEITEAHVRGARARLMQLLDRMLTLTNFAAIFAGALFCVWSVPLAQLLYHSAEAGYDMTVLAPVMPFMYLESMVDGALKGLGEQKASFGYTVWDSVFRIAGVTLLLPRFGMDGFLFVMLCSNVFTCMMNLLRLIRAARLPVRLWGWLFAPLAAAVPSVLAGRAVWGLLGGTGWAALAAGCGTAGMLYLALGWPLGLGRAAGGIRGERRKKSRGKM